MLAPLDTGLREGGLSHASSGSASLHYCTIAPVGIFVPCVYFCVALAARREFAFPPQGSML